MKPMSVAGEGGGGGGVLGGQLLSQFWLKGKNVGKFSPKCWTISLRNPPLLLQIGNFNYIKLNKYSMPAYCRHGEWRLFLRCSFMLDTVSKFPT
jgi:hypothetical protein